jgi:hypothetical protein
MRRFFVLDEDRAESRTREATRCSGFLLDKIYQAQLYLLGRGLHNLRQQCQQLVITFGFSQRGQPPEAVLHMRFDERLQSAGHVVLLAYSFS